jgi:hypothetical protein
MTGRFTVCVSLILLLGSLRLFGSELQRAPFDTLRNESRLTDGELRFCFERSMEDAIAEAIDRDGDGKVDNMHMDVEEFIGRMFIILHCRKPFDFKPDPRLDRVTRTRHSSESGQAPVTSPV